MNNWPINDATAELLEARMQANPPKLALDVGSGRSTVIMARYAERVVALEHDYQFYREIYERVCGAQLLGADCLLVYAPMKPFAEGPWYTYDLQDTYDFVLIDGPPGWIGRQAGLPLLWPHLAEGFEVWLDDWDRQHEKQCVKDWQARFPIVVEELLPTLAKITRAP